MKVLRGLLAGVALLAILVAAPVALATWGHLGGLAAIDWTQALTLRDDGTLLLGVLTLIGWLVWSVLAVSIVVELADVVRSRPWQNRAERLPLTVPGLDLPRALVRGLVLAVVATIVSAGPSVTPGSAVPVTAVVASAPPVAEIVGGDLSPAIRKPGNRAEPSSMASPRPGPAALHVVQPGDDLWTLAVAYYGDGTRWRQIADANADLVSGGMEIEAGWRLAVPDAPAQPGETVVVVVKGDTLWGLAGRYLGDPERWREIHQANLDLVDDPDQIDVGWRLRLPGAPVTPPSGSAATGQGEPSVTGQGEPSVTAAQPAAKGPAATAEPTGRTTTSAPTAPATTTAPTTTATTAAPAVSSAATTGERPDAVPSPVSPASAASAASAGSVSGAARRPAPGTVTVVPLPTTATATTTATAATTTTTSAPPPSTPTPRTEPSAPAESAVAVPPGADPAPGEPGLPPAPAVALVGGVGAVLAGGLIAQLRRRRQLQLAMRPVGRRIVHPDPEIARVATALAQVSAPDLLEGVDAVVRTLGTPRLTGRGVAVLAGEHGVSVVERGGAEQHYRGDYVAHLVSALAEHSSPQPASPVPALVAVGSDSAGRQVLVDLEAAGVLTIEVGDPLPTCVAIGLELACTPWSEGVQVVAAGMVARVLSAEVESIVHEPDTEAAAADALRRLRSQRLALERTGGTLAELRADDDTRDAWTPHVFLFGPDLAPATAARLRAEALAGDPVAVAVVLADGQAPPSRAVAAESIVAGSPRRAADDPARGVRIVASGQNAALEPYGIIFQPQQLPPVTSAAVTALLAVTGSDATTPAPWFAAAEPSDSVTSLHLHSPGPAKEAVAVGPTTSSRVTDFSHPTLLLLGPIELTGAAGPPPPRAERSCIEYCAWLLEHPGATATAMANALVVAEGTRRSNVSRLRTWLGSADDGQQYLPDAYSGRLYLDPCVSSDWHRLQLLIAPGVGRVTRDTLVAALTLVRGAPLADAAPGQWHWAEELRTDMSSTIRDIGVVVADGAVADGDIDLARWASARALTAAPEDELLLCCRIKAEHRAGNRGEVERLVLRLTRHARLLGIDLADETVVLIQQVIEGRPRARA